MGFSVPRRLRFGRWALTPPFHPYPAGISNWTSEIPDGRFEFLWHCPSERLAASPPACILVSAFLRRQRRVTRHRALWCSDFPPPAHARSDSPPFRNREQPKLPARERQAMPPFRRRQRESAAGWLGAKSAFLPPVEKLGRGMPWKPADGTSALGTGRRPEPCRVTAWCGLGRHDAMEEGERDRRGRSRRRLADGRAKEEQPTEQFLAS